MLGTRFILPNKLRSTRDPNTNQRIRAPGHFLFKLEFGDLSFQIFRTLRAGFGQRLNEKNKAARDNGETDLLAIYFHRTQEEQQRRQRRRDGNN